MITTDPTLKSNLAMATTLLDLYSSRVLCIAGGTFPRHLGMPLLQAVVYPIIKRTVLMLGK